MKVKTAQENRVSEETAQEGTWASAQVMGSGGAMNCAGHVGERLSRGLVKGMWEGNQGKGQERQGQCDSRHQVHLFYSSVSLPGWFELQACGQGPAQTGELETGFWEAKYFLLPSLLQKSRSLWFCNIYIVIHSHPKGKWNNGTLNRKKCPNKEKEKRAISTWEKTDSATRLFSMWPQTSNSK